MASNLPISTPSSSMKDASIFGLASSQNTETLNNTRSNPQIAREVSEFLAIPIMKPFRRRAIKTFFRQMSGVMTDAVVDAATVAYGSLGYDGRRPSDQWWDEDQRNYPVRYSGATNNTARQVARVFHWHSGKSEYLTTPTKRQPPDSGWFNMRGLVSRSSSIRPSWNWVGKRETEPVKLLVLEWFAIDCLESLPRMKEFAAKPYFIDAVKEEIKSPAWQVHLEMLLAMHAVAAFQDELTGLFIKLLALSHIGPTATTADPFRGLAPGLLQAVVDLDKAVWGGNGIGGPGPLIDITLESAWISEISTFDAHETEKWDEFNREVQQEVQDSCCVNGQVFPLLVTGFLPPFKPQSANDLLGPPQDDELRNNISSRSLAEVLYCV